MSYSDLRENLGKTGTAKAFQACDAGSIPATRSTVFRHFSDIEAPQAAVNSRYDRRPWPFTPPHTALATLHWSDGTREVGCG